MSQIFIKKASLTKQEARKTGNEGWQKYVTRFITTVCTVIFPFTSTSRPVINWFPSLFWIHTRTPLNEKSLTFGFKTRLFYHITFKEIIYDEISCILTSLWKGPRCYEMGKVIIARNCLSYKEKMCIGRNIFLSLSVSVSLYFKCLHHSVSNALSFLFYPPSVPALCLCSLTSLSLSRSVSLSVFLSYYLSIFFWLYLSLSNSPSHVCLTLILNPPLSLRLTLSASLFHFLYLPFSWTFGSFAQFLILFMNLIFHVHVFISAWNQSPFLLRL